MTTLPREIEREVLLQIYFHVAALFEPVRNGRDSTAWRSLTYFRFLYPKKGVRMTSVMAGIRNRAHFHAAVNSLKAKGLIRERKSGSTKEGNFYWLTSKALDVSCLLLGLSTVRDAEIIVGAIAYHQVEHMPAYEHTWVNEQCLLNNLHDYNHGRLQTQLLATFIAGIVENSCDLPGRAAYRIPEPTMDWIIGRWRKWVDIKCRDAPPHSEEAVASGDEMSTSDLEEAKWTIFRSFLDGQFDLECFPGFEHIDFDDRPKPLDIDIWANVDRAKDNIRAQLASMPAGEIGAIPLCASGAPWINYGPFEGEPDLYKLREKQHVT